MSALFDKLRIATSTGASSLVLRSIRCSPAFAIHRQPATSIVNCIEQRRQRSASRNWKNLRRERRARKHDKIVAAVEAARAAKAAKNLPRKPPPPEMLSQATLDGKEFRTVSEGKATILIPEGAKIGEDTREVQQVFYNPIQQYNRDLSVLAIKAFGEEQMEKREAARQKATDSKKADKKRKRVSEGNQEPKRACLEDNENVVTEGAEPATTADAESEPATAPGAVEGETVAPDATAQKPKPVSPLTILDALSASGLRALRYAHELPFPTQIKANDLSASAAKSIQVNVDHNGVQDKVTVTNDDALALMYRAIADGLSGRDARGFPTNAGKFDVIDLDPYGTAAPFFDAAVQAVKDSGGLLLITCTDSAVWAGHSYAEKTFSLYGGLPVKGLHSHEAGLRLILNAVATSAARYGLTIEPQLSLSIDFYTKLFIKVRKSPQAVKFLAAKTMIVYNCDHGCGAWETQPLMRSQKSPNKKGNGYFYKHIASQGPTSDRTCQHCGQKMHITGPMYAGRIHTPKFIERILAQLPDADPAVYKTLPRIEGMLRTALEEHIEAPSDSLLASNSEKTTAQVDEYAVVDHTPFYVVPAKLAHVLYCQTPPDDLLRGALIKLGYQARRSHCRPGSIKTDAPWSTIWKIMAEWVRQRSPLSPGRIEDLKRMNKRPAYRILSKAGVIDTTEEETAGRAEGDSRREQMNRPKRVSPMAEEVDELDNLDLSDFARDDPVESIVFDEALAKLGRSKEPRLVRYQANPEPNWGPLSRASRQ